MKLIKNKKGAFGIILFFLILISIIIIGFGAALIWSVIDIVSDEVTPIMTELGTIGGANVSEAAESTFGVVDTFVQALPWLIALAYVLGLVFVLVFVFVVGYSPHPAFIALYFVLMILLIFGCIIMSNIYQDIYTGTDEISLRLQEQTILSYMILYSPTIMFTFAIIGGILMFARRSDAEGNAGGYGI